MSRQEFLSSLTIELSDIPKAEREAAIKYYEEYFSDAGEENEQDVLASLGTPKQVASNIKADLFAQGKAEESFDENAKYNVPNNNGSYPASKNGYQNNQSQYSQNGTGGTNTTQKSSGLGTAGIVILLVLSFPIWFPVVMAVLGVLFSVLIALIAFMFAMAVTGVVCSAVGIVVFVTGIVKLFILPFGGLCLMGIGLIVVAIGILCLLLTVLLCGKCIPALFRGIVDLISRPFHRKECAA